MQCLRNYRVPFAGRDALCRTSAEKVTAANLQRNFAGVGVAALIYPGTVARIEAGSHSRHVGNIVILKSAGRKVKEGKPKKGGV